MAKIINLTPDILEKSPHAIRLFYHLFGEKKVDVYAFQDDKDVALLGVSDNNCLYVDKEGSTNFLVEGNKLASIRVGNYTAFFGDMPYVIDEKGIEYSLELRPLSTPDIDDYDGYVSFLQYNPDNDCLCEIDYQQMYRLMGGIPRIYSFHTKKIDEVYIDEDYTKKGSQRISRKNRILNKKAHYFSRVEFESDMLGYKISKIKEIGLINFLQNNDYTLDRDTSLKYIKAFGVTKDGAVIDAGLFAREYTQQEVKDLIASYGFKNELPEKLIDIFNGDNSRIIKIREVIDEFIKTFNKDSKEVVKALQLTFEK